MTAFPGALGVYREHPWARSSSVHSSRAGRATPASRRGKSSSRKLRGFFPKSRSGMLHSQDLHRGGPDVPFLTWLMMSVPPYRRYETPPSSETAPQPQAFGVQNGVLHIPEQHPQLARKFPDDPAGEPGGLNPSREERRSWSQGNSAKGWHSDSPTLISRCSRGFVFTWSR